MIVAYALLIINFQQELIKAGLILPSLDNKNYEQIPKANTLTMPIYKVVCQPSNNQFETNFASLGTENAKAHISELVAMCWTRGGLKLTARGALRFNLSEIPKSAKIISARLSLFSNPTPLNGNHSTSNFGSDNSFYVFRIKSPWNQKTGWLNQPNIEITDNVLVPHSSKDFQDVLNLDVKGIVSSMLKNGNYGFKLQLVAEDIYTIRNFASSLHNDLSKHPKLIVQYSLPQ